jgi:hypothetical protein
MKQYWAYKHINGGIHVKLYWSTCKNIDPAYEDAYCSPFVDKVTSIFEAENREQAEEIAKEKLNFNKKFL